jgi:hypothetical protein
MLRTDGLLSETATELIEQTFVAPSLFYYLIV